MEYVQILGKCCMCDIPNFGRNDVFNVISNYAENDIFIR